MGKLYYNKPDAEWKNQKALYQETEYKAGQKRNGYSFISSMI